MKILIIRLRLIGDVVFTTPMLRALKRAYPEAHLTYLVEREAAPVVRGNPHLDEVLVVPRRRGWRRILDDVRLARSLRARRFDLVLDLHGGPRSSVLARATGARRRIGYAVAGRAWLYTAVVDRPRELRPRHSVVNQWDLLDALDGWSGDAPDPARDAVEMALDPAADRRVADRLRAAGGGEHDLILMHVSAGNPFRRWPETAFVQAGAALVSTADTRRLIVSSGPSDRAAARRIARLICRQLPPAQRDRVLDVGELDLAELRALIGRSRLFIGGDTGPLHVAATTRTPIVGLYGPTLASRSAPWRDPAVPTAAMEIHGLSCRPCEQRVCAPGDFRCLTRIDPAQVVEAAERLMGNRP